MVESAGGVAALWLRGFITWRVFSAFENSEIDICCACRFLEPDFLLEVLWWYCGEDSLELVRTLSVRASCFLSERERTRHHTPSVELSMESCVLAVIMCVVAPGWIDCSMQSFEKSRKTHTIANAK